MNCGNYGRQERKMEAMTNEEIAREAALQCYNGVHIIDRTAIILEHDKEVRKPLVQALEKIAQLISQELDLPRYEPAVTATLTDVGRIARTALAKVKE